MTSCVASFIFYRWEICVSTTQKKKKKRYNFHTRLRMCWTDLKDHVSLFFFSVNWGVKTEFLKGDEGGVVPSTKKLTFKFLKVLVNSLHDQKNLEPVQSCSRYAPVVAWPTLLYVSTTNTCTYLSVNLKQKKLVGI